MPLLLNINKFIEKNNVEYITTSNIMRAEKPDDGGLFSHKIFGLPNSKKWRTAFGAIALNVQILHPLLYEIADRRCSLLNKFLEGSVSYDEQTKKIRKDSMGQSGILYLVEHTEEVVRALINTGTITAAGVKLLTYILKYKDIAFMDNMLVCSPQYRPMETKNNKLELDPVNTYYINLINDAAVAKFAKGQSLAVVTMRIQQNAYMAYSELAKSIKGKRGIQRGALLSKVLDFTARAVITGDINIDPDHYGVPKKIALSLFKYHMLHALIFTHRDEFEALGERPSQLNAGRIIDKMIEGSNGVPTQVQDFVYKVLEEVIKDKVVLAKRDPALHRNSLRAMYVSLVDDDTFHINPLLCNDYNADFDGDTMCIFLPVTDRAQQIAKKNMLVGSTFASAQGNGLSIGIKKDTALGIYALTGEYQGENKPKPVKVTTPDEAEAVAYKERDPGAPVIYNGKETTAGRAIFEICIGVAVTEQLNKKKATKIFESLAGKVPSRDLFNNVAKVIRYGCRMASLLGKSIDITNYSLKQEFKDRRDDIFASGVDIPKKLDQLTKDIVADFGKNKVSFISDMLASGAESKLNAIQSSFVAKGFVANVDGEVIPTPVKNSTGEGLKPVDYYQSSISGRSGIIDRAVNTRVSGYLSRKLVYGLSSVKLDPSISTIRVYKPFAVDVKDGNIAKGLDHRTTMSGKIITDPDAYIGKTVEIVSPLYWTTRELGLQCIPDYIYRNLGNKNIGIAAAQSIGERASQLTMQTFHMTSSKGFENFLSSDDDLSKMCIQDTAGNIIAKTPLIIKIDREDITDMSSDEYVFKDFSIENAELKIELSLQYNFTLLVTDKSAVHTDSDNMIVAHYGEGDTFGSMKNSANSISGAVAQIVRLTDTRIVTNQERMVSMLYGLLDGVPMWAVEILVSQLFRDPDNPSIPYRCGNHKKLPMRIGLKKVAVNEDWRRGAAFENIGEALTTAVINDLDKSDAESDLDKIVCM